MPVGLQEIHDKLENALNRIRQLEERFPVREPASWRYLVARPHPWRCQLSIKGRNLTVGQLVSTLFANGLTPDQAAADVELPVDAVHEALAYYKENRSLIELEVAEERRRLAEKGYPLEPENLPG